MINVISGTVAVRFGKKQNPEVCVGAMKMTTQNFHVEEIE